MAANYIKKTKVAVINNINCNFASKESDETIFPYLVSLAICSVR